MLHPGDLLGQVTSTQNYVSTSIPREGGISNQVQLDRYSLPRQQQITYLDGLGRPIQQVQVKASPQSRDIVMPVTYDALGRPATTYLPYAIGGSGAYQSDALNQQSSFYRTNGDRIADDTQPYSRVVYDTSPLNRVIEQGAAGAAWQPGTTHTQRLTQRTNTNGEVKLFFYSGSTVAGPSYYAAQELLVKEILDENGASVAEYTDKDGHVVLKSVQAGASEYLLTYYVYDDLGHLRLVIPPEGVRQIPGIVLSDSFIATWCFSYTYDGRGRITQKQVPGAGTTRYVYNQRDQLVGTQNQRETNNPDQPWLLTKYDALGRPVLTAYAVLDRNQSELQGDLDGQPTTALLYESRTTSTVGYTLTQSYPSVAEGNVRTITYYDDYSYPTMTGFGFRAEAGLRTDQPLPQAQGLVTGTRVLVEETNTFLTSVTYYDGRYRPLQILSDDYLGGRDRVTMNYGNFLDNNPRQLLTTHRESTQGSPTNATHIIAERLSYDLSDRLLEHWQNVDGDGEILLARYEYNELGQLVDKKLHSKAADPSFLQSVDYRYNIRGWLSHINDRGLTNNGTYFSGTDPNADDPATEAPDLFGMELLYNAGQNLPWSTPQYNGNISEVMWKTRNNQTGNTLRGYSYNYDKANRLTSARYGTYEWNGSYFSWGIYGTDFSVAGRDANTPIDYDRNGNILHLTRQGSIYGPIGNPVKGLLDQLTYSYQGNRLIGVDDAAPVTSANHDFEDNGRKFAASGVAEYGYDSNGNLTQDQNKGIASISYNLLNLPTNITFTSGSHLEYTYTATGTKLQQRVYQGSTLIKRVDYAGGFVYEQQTPVFVQTAEGRALYTPNSGGYKWKYEYHIKDHLGNLRFAFREGGGGSTNRMAGMEPANAAKEEQEFDHVAETPPAGCRSCSHGQLRSPPQRP